MTYGATAREELRTTLEAEVVERMDEAWRTRGIKNRMEFFRRALGHYLSHLGAEEAAALFVTESASGGATAR